MSKSLPLRPNLEQLKNQAKDLLKSHKSGDSSSNQRIREYHPRWSNRTEPELASAKLSLSEAQLVIAREYGFASWPKLKEHVESITDDIEPKEALKAAVLDGDVRRAAEVLERHPMLKSRLNDPLLDYGFGAPPLLAAVQRSNKEMIDLLLRAGADINGRSQWWAGSFGVLDTASGLESYLIQRGAFVDAHAAARLGMMDRLKELISSDPNLVHARGGDGQTPLHFAANIEVAGYLLEHGADIDALDIDHESTPAQYMVRDRQDVARFLVSRGCRTDILMTAALGDLELTRRHLDADPACIRTSVNERYFPKRNPRAGGSIYIWTLYPNKTAHSLAREFRHEAVFRLLMERTPEELKLALACELGDEALFRSLLARNPGLVRSLSDDDRRKLANAAQSNNIEAVRLMLEAGWPVDVRGQHGATPLHFAALRGNAEMVEIILRYNPPLEALDDNFDGEPLGWAIHGSEHSPYAQTGNYARTVEALVRAGAELPARLMGSPAVKEVFRRFGVKDGGDPGVG